MNSNASTRRISKETSELFDDLELHANEPSVPSQLLHKQTLRLTPYLKELTSTRPLHGQDSRNFAQIYSRAHLNLLKRQWEMPSLTSHPS